MSDEVLAQARRLHMHVMSGGNVTAMDMSRLVQGMERMQADRDRMRESIYKALSEIEDAGPKALKYAAQELRAAIGEGRA
jgi:hypothetical protein